MSQIKYCSMEDKDIRHYLPNAKIITYDELSNLQNISELLPKHQSYVIILSPIRSATDGHWVCLTRYRRVIEYFDSYGNKPDEPLSWGEYKGITHHLSKLLNKTNLRVVYNDIAFQSKLNKAISTCGAYVVFRILTMIEMNADLNKNNLILKTLKEVNEDKTYDDFNIS